MSYLDFQLLLYVSSEQYEPCRTFYEQVFATQPFYGWDEGPEDRGVKYDLAGTKLVLLTQENPFPTSGAVHFQLQVQTLEDIAAEFTRKNTAVQPLEGVGLYYETNITQAFRRLLAEQGYADVADNSEITYVNGSAKANGFDGTKVQYIADNGRPCSTRALSSTSPMPGSPRRSPSVPPWGAAPTRCRNCWRAPPGP